VRAHALSLALVALLGLVPAASAVEPLWPQVEGIRNDQAYSDASAWRRAQIRSVVADLVRGAATDSLPASAQRRAQAAGLDLRVDASWIVLSSTPDKADGFYVIRRGGQVQPLVIEAPHAWHDLETGRLSCALFEAGYGRALLVNTAQRYSPSQGDASAHVGDLGADVAHRPESVYQAVTLGVVDALNDPLVVQIHGFGSKHGSHAAVLSEGAAFQPQGQLQAALDQLETVLGQFGSLSTGEEVPDLAARNNVQSQAISGSARFLHMELSLAARRKLVADPALRAQLGETLEDLTERSP
jgi:hypothetical protein